MQLPQGLTLDQPSQGGLPPGMQIDSAPDSGTQPKGVVRRFAERALHLPDDIGEHPGAYLNPFSKEYWDKGKQEREQEKANPPEVTAIPPFLTQAHEDIKSGNYAGAAGDVVGPAYAAASAVGPLLGKGLSSPTGGKIITRGGKYAGAAVGGKIGGWPGAAVGYGAGEVAAEPLAGAAKKLGGHMERSGLASFRAPAPDAAVPAPEAPAPAPYRVSGNKLTDPATVTPRQLIGPERQLGTGETPVPSPAAKPVARTSEQPAQWPPERPSVIQPREFRGRADSLEDKGFQEANREDLEKHGHSAFSQAKRDWFARNVPGSSKGDLVVQSKGEVGVPSPNGSGESSASQEAISRVASEKAQKIERVRIDTRSGKETKLFGVDAVDAKAGPYDRIIKRGPNGEEIQDEGAKARPVSSTPRVPKTDEETESLLMNSIKRARSAKAGDD